MSIHLLRAETIVPDPQNPMAAYQANKNSDLQRLFTAWNISYDAKKVILDKKYALNIQRHQGARPVRHLAYLALTNEAFNTKDIIARDLDTINLATTGYFESDNLQPILSTSLDASTATTEALKFLVDPNVLFKNFVADNKSYIIAGRLSGTINSAFTDSIEGVDKSTVILENTDPKVILFADVDILFDQMWVRSQNFFGRQVYSAFADNGNMITNMLDNMAGSPDLINIRGRKNSARPFTKVFGIAKSLR